MFSTTFNFSKAKFFFWLIGMEELQAVLRKHGYEYVGKIGYGGFSEVYKVFSLKYRQHFAVKVIDIHYQFLVKQKTASYFQEVNVLKQIQHRNIISIYDHFQEDNYFFIVLEYCSSGSLDSIIHHSQSAIMQKNLDSIIHQMLTALAICHTNNVAHHDIKPSNFCIDQYMRIKLADFGVATHNEGPNSSLFGGTLMYSAPEVFERKPYDPYKADIWSAGVTILQLITRRLPHASDTRPIIMKAIEADIQVLDKLTSPYVKEIIQKSLIIDPSKRADASELLEIIRPHIPTKHIQSIQSHKSIFISSAPINIFRLPPKSRSIQKLDDYL